MDDPTRSQQQQRRSSGHIRYAGRVPAGSEQPIVLQKNGVRHVSLKA